MMRLARPGIDNVKPIGVDVDPAAIGDEDIAAFDDQHFLMVCAAKARQILGRDHGDDDGIQLLPHSRSQERGGQAYS